MNSNVGFMPEEILFDILTMLPVKSLCRFRCVSKSWLTIISNPEFVAAHLALSRSRPKLLISVHYVDPLPNKGMCSFFSIDYPELEGTNTQPLHATAYRPVEFGDPSMISTSPTGLICFTCPDGVKIGNPFTGDFKVIPYPITDSNTYVFFGSDPLGKSHVVLKLEERDYTSNIEFGKSGVFDLVDNYWHVTPPHPWVVSGGDSGICINGVIYFIALAERTQFAHPEECLYAFDVTSKCFQMIDRPLGSLHDRFFIDELLIEYNGRLALVGDGDARDTSVDETCLWILEDPGRRSWSFKSFVVPWKENLKRDGISTKKLGSFYSGGRKVKLFGATDRGELIFATPLSRNSVYLFLYEIETSSLRRFEVDGLTVNPCSCEVARFDFVIESLQTPKHLRRKRKKVAFINVHPPCS